eukprot:TRINITY_DN8784_c0_g1_i6.p4 TRINITY_DN8784_c0_g1~~TRINITY_DN8784_c0_g1_i6.p4  ORF type:complete len:110 (-),score=7.86 TRINITY_DN8784_c0_g1_i6:417-746(-)
MGKPQIQTFQKQFQKETNQFHNKQMRQPQQTQPQQTQSFRQPPQVFNPMDVEQGRERKFMNQTKKIQLSGKSCITETYFFLKRVVALRAGAKRIQIICLKQIQRLVKIS